MIALSWVLSAITITVMWLAGNKSVWAWRLSLLNQGLWLWYIIGTQSWGLLPMNAAMWFVSARNLFRWGRQ